MVAALERLSAFLFFLFYFLRTHKSYLISGRFLFNPCACGRSWRSRSRQRLPPRLQQTEVATVAHNMVIWSFPTSSASILFLPLPLFFFFLISQWCTSKRKVVAVLVILASSIAYEIILLLFSFFLPEDLLASGFSANRAPLVGAAALRLRASAPHGWWRGPAGPTASPARPAEVP